MELARGEMENCCNQNAFALSLSSPLEVFPVIAARGLGGLAERLSSPAGPVKPGHQTPAFWCIFRLSGHHFGKNFMQFVLHNFFGRGQKLCQRQQWPRRLGGAL